MKTEKIKEIKRFRKNSEYYEKVFEIIDEYSSIKLTKKQLAEKMVERYGGDFKSHYWRIARMRFI